MEDSHVNYLVDIVIYCHTFKNTWHKLHHISSESALPWPPALDACVAVLSASERSWDCYKVAISWHTHNRF